jgi:hypothetical protein
VFFILLLACGDEAPPAACTTSRECDRGVCIDGRCVELDAAIERDGGAFDARVDAHAPVDADVSTFAFDLDRDGANDTNLAVVACEADAAALCLAVERDETFEIRLADAGKPAAMSTASITGRDLVVLGDHGGGALSEVSIAFALAGAHDTPALAIADVDARTVLARASAPPSLAAFATYALAAYVTYPRDAAGRIIPALMPGYGDDPTATWGYGCAFSATATGAPRCGDGFVEMNTVPVEPGWFREVGGYLYDADGDGTEDVHLLFHQRVLTFSPVTGALLASTTFDVAAADEPSSPPWFHSGRNYGTHSVRTGSPITTLMIGGAPVGTFTDANCNVSRFVATLAATPGSPASRTLAWSDYFGFASSIFVRYDPAYLSNPSADLARLGDFVDGCIHRFSDSRTTIDGVDAAIFDYFDAEAPYDTCLVQQYDLYLPPAWTDEKARVWYECFNRNVASMGRWGMQARRVGDGASVTGSQDTYVWGRSDRLLPGGEILYLVEVLPSRVRFDLADVPPSALRVYALVAGLWTERGVFPVAGRPALRSVMPEGAIGVGSFTGLAELDALDLDGDGLDEIALTDGTRIGASGTTFVVK